jgi:hypothetical protein
MHIYCNETTKSNQFSTDRKKGSREIPRFREWKKDRSDSCSRRTGRRPGGARRDLSAAVPLELAARSRAPLSAQSCRYSRRRADRRRPWGNLGTRSQQKKKEREQLVSGSTTCCLLETGADRGWGMGMSRPGLRHGSNIWSFPQTLTKQQVTFTIVVYENECTLNQLWP